MSHIQRDELPGYLTIIRTYNDDGRLIMAGYSRSVNEPAKAERDALIELLRRAQRRGPIGLKLLRDITAALAAAKAKE